jgi:branched-chain amino acid transport system permease protein
MGPERRNVLGGAALLVALAAGPLFGQIVHIDTSFLAEVLLTAIAAYGVNLLLGYTGLPIFGIAAFFGLGAYGAALSIKDLHVGFLSAILIGTVLAIVGALIVAPFLLRRRNIYFGLLSIAFGQVFYFIAYRYSALTGGEDGMSFIRPQLALGTMHFKVSDLMMYYIIYVLFVVATITFWLIVRSPFGQTLVAIKQNELRVRYLGLNTDRFIFLGMLVAATYTGIAGTLYGLLLRFAFPLLMDWHQSGNLVLMTILGGAGTIFGPLVGAIIFVIGKDIISTITPTWEIFLGAFFIACVLGFPKGILGTFAEITARRRRGAQQVIDEAEAFDQDDEARSLATKAGGIS